MYKATSNVKTCKKEAREEAKILQSMQRHQKEKNERKKLNVLSVVHPIYAICFSY